ncbi:hypothetical protein SG34_023365 [Thalassomonas viridans]|uniref:Uncharacterized protein n=1 Tax=Thalassomonas viridans TaxID=137584 RepID=A0AAE9Z1D5_9GAMM|nr:hypothetical protein [Thalassomonas viridans]WDE04250.1 hypothetical protein SG34_023365 [Thalassomonas viridans]
MDIKRKELELRQSFKVLLLQNPNYFGNLTDCDQASPAAIIAPKISDTTFEELTCLGYNPQTKDLGAVVRIKLTGGYSGGPCTDGSKEYVRFYLDYGDGVWIDEGVVNFDAHDLPFDEHLCYAVKHSLKPKKQTCCDKTPVLPKVRAILSWNLEPPANQPNWLPIWGNRLECDIQIEPRNDFFCNLVAQLGDLVVQEIDPLVLEQISAKVAEPAKPLPVAQTYALKQSYGKKVEDARLGFKPVYQLAANPGNQLALAQSKTLKQAGLNIGKITDFLKFPQFNTSYEELKCVGLDRDASVLHADVLVKKPSGYSGDLCQDGSREYVAFYLDFGSGWQYMGTSSVGVHDIPEIPDSGLCYLVTLPVNLTEQQKVWCETGKAKIRGILSWNVPPVPGNPNYIAHWGDWEDCCIEIRPLPNGVIPGTLTPVIESIGSMPVLLINAAGYANGSNSVGLTGIESPFDGNILISGIIANQINSSDPLVPRLKYRLMIKAPSSAMQPWTKEFEIFTTTISGGIPGPQVAVTQVPDSDGWVDYYPDFMVPDTISVDDNMLGLFVPTEAGLHEIYIEVDDPNSAVNITSASEFFMVDKKAPDVDIEITSGTGNCGKFTVGDIISGTFSMTDDHSLALALSVTPTAEANGATPEITGSGGASSLSYSGGTLPGGGTAGTWSLDTGNGGNPMDPCGYNIRIRGEDRTIVNSAFIGHENWDIEGFCLED